MFTKMFLGCIPLRIGCVVLAYVGLTCSVIVLCFSSMWIREAMNEYNEAARTNNYTLVYESGEERLSDEEEEMAFMLGFSWMVLVGVSYFVFHGLFIICSVLLAVGATLRKRILVKVYFVHGTVHFFLVLFLASLHFFMDEYVETAVTVCADVLFMLCLFGVKGFLDTMGSGHGHHESVNKF